MQSREKGFTLIELIVVIAIIGILAAIVVPNLFGLTENAKESSARAMGSALVAGLWADFADDLDFPLSSTHGNITALIEDVDEWTAAQGAEGSVATTYTMEGDADYVVAVYSDAQGFVVTYTYSGTADDEAYELSGGQKEYYDVGEVNDALGIAIPD